MAWTFGRYVSAVAEAGKKEYPLPMYANDWLKQPGFEDPGQYPSGGPTAHMLDIWRAAAQSVADESGAGAPPLDFFAPDIYAPDFRQITADYHRAGNPLFIPESNQIVGRAYYAFGEHSAICYSPFAIDSYSGDQAQSLAQAYEILGGLSPLLLGPYQSRGIMIYPDEESEDVDLDSFRFHVTRARHPFGAPPPPAPAAGGAAASAIPAPPQADQYAGGLIISLGANQYLIAGSDITATVEMNPLQSNKVNFVKIEEGVYRDGRWTPGRRLNGDENHITLHQPGELKITVYPF
jgi:hypothetical protein